VVFIILESPRLRRLLSYLFGLVLACSPLFSQSPSFNYQKFGTEEGLNNANIFSIAQHENGSMYFTTQNGIYRYDGYAFERIGSDSVKSNALQGFAFRSARELYLSIRDEGLATYDLKTGAYSLDRKLRFSDNNADQFVVAGDFAYLLTTEIRLVIINLRNGEIRQDELRKKDRHNPPYCVFRTADGRVLVGRQDGLYDATDGTQRKLPVLSGIPVYSLAEDKTGRLFAGSSGRMLIVNGESVEAEIVPKFSAPVNSFQPGGERSINKLVADRYGRIWFTVFPEENLYLYENNKVHDVFALLDIPPSLIRCISLDARHNIWVGTFTDGVYFIQNTFFNTLTFSYLGKPLNVNQVLLTDQLLIAATSNGLYGLSSGSGEAKVLSYPDELFMEPVNSIVRTNGAFYYTKRSQFSVSPSIFLDASRAYRFKPVIARQFHPVDALRSIVADWDANILMANADGSATLDTLISFTDYRISVNGLLLLNDTLYVATSNGLYAHLFQNRTTKLLDRPELNYHINDISFTNGRILAAHEAGITDVRAGKLIQQLGPFALNSVKRIRLFGGHYWVGTLDGVYVCDSTFTPLKVIDKTSGLPSNSVNDLAFNASQVCIATVRGVSTAYYKNILGSTPRLKQVAIGRVEWNGHEIPFDGDMLRLGPDQEDIVVHIMSPVFVKPNRQQFRYRLDGGEWISSGAIPQLNLALRGGTHELLISATTDNISWSEPVSLTIRKDEKLTEKAYVFWLAAMIVLGVMLLAGALIIRRVKASARRRLLEEQQVNLLKHQAMNALLSPHFIFNSLTSIQNYINTNNSLKASEYLAKFSRLIRMIIEKAAQGTITVYDELSRLTYYLELEKERFKNKFSYLIHIDANLNTHEISIPNMIIQPHVENCILHGILPTGDPGQLEIFFRLPEPGRLQIIIQDDGIGLIKAAEHAKTGHKSLGIATIRDILEVNSKLSGKKQVMTMVDRSTLDPLQHGTIITIELEL
jgi:ligand-binding sensor domain-containing protein